MPLAPDMLAALEALIAVDDHNQKIGAVVAYPDFKNVRAAVAKARGDSQ